MTTPRRAGLRVLATNDFVCSVDPRPASFGVLPGAGGLRDAVARLKDGIATLWLDAGDFAGWSPLASLSSGHAAFAASARFGFDAACPGNHEFDWGVDLAARFARDAPFPILCANIPAELPAMHISQTPIGAAGLLGITMPELGDPATLPELIRGSIAQLRGQGCVIVIVLLHDGVSSSYSARHTIEADTSDFLAKHGDWLDAADLVVAGHTLARWLGPLGGAVVVQPWAFGAEVAIVDFDARGRIQAVAAVSPRPGPGWRGPGMEINAIARAQKYGSLETPAGCSISGDRTLPDRMASAVRSATGADAALVPAAYLATQPAIDGVTAWIPPGEVDELAIQRLAPYPDDQVLACAVTRQEWAELIRQFTAPGLQEDAVSHRGEEWWRFLAGRSLADTVCEELLLAVPEPWPKPVEQLLQRPVSWSRTGIGLKQALRLRLCAPPDRP